MTKPKHGLPRARGILPRRIRGGWIFPFVVGIGGALAILIATSRFGPGLTPDSVQYLAAAESYLAGDGLQSIDGSPFVWWAPGYPVALAGLSRMFSTEPVVAARWLNAILAVLNTILAWIILNRTLGRDWRSYVGLLVVALGFGSMVVSSKMLSETAFASAILGMIVALGGGLTWRGIIAGSVFASLAFIFRYAGVAFVVAAMSYIVVARPAWKHRWSKVGGFGLISVFPTALWLLSNQRDTGTFTGRRGAVVPELVSVIGLDLGGIPELFVPPILPLWIAVPAGLLIVWVIGLSLVKMTGAVSDPTDRYWPAGRVLVAGTESLCAVLVVGYLLFLLLTSILGWSSPVNARLLNPILVPVVALLLARLGSIRRVQSGQSRRRMLLVAAVAGLSIGSGAVYVGMRAQMGGGGLNTNAWRNSPTIAALSSTPSMSPIWSNKPEAVRFFRGVRAVQIDLSSDQPGDGDLIAWFDDTNRNTDSYAVWARRLASGLFFTKPDALQTGMSQDLERSEPPDCAAVGRSLTTLDFLVLDQTTDGCILAITNDGNP